jgi:ectoine hydroxylase-related dioxygenase (phytanoyl-CoA dioxygenase family)
MFVHTQHTQTHTHNLNLQVLGEHLGAMAAALLGVDGVRVYQDCVFVKQPGFGETNWHSDLRMTPFDTNASVTCWLPMRAVEGGDRDSGLQFAEGSHRDFALPFWHDARTADLETRGYTVASAGRLLPGDCTWHHGWTVHSAGPQLLGSLPRTALAVTFIADGARTLDTRARSLRKGMRHDEDAESYGDWLGAVKPGAPARHPLLPLTYTRG